MPFNIHVADTAGFCFGVRKALDKLLEIRNTNHGPVRTLGPLIHNEQVLEALKTRSVEELSPGEDVAGTHVILRAHGVKPDTRNALKARNAVVCDATCPKVAQVQAIVKKHAQRGVPVIIIGDRGHAEVDGLLGYAGKMGIVITDIQEAWNLRGGSVACVVAQTTQDPHVFREIVKIVEQKYDQCDEFNTICDATSERQAETRSMAVESDMMIVVGGRNSANSKRLFEIANQHCRAVMIQTAADLSTDMFADVRRIGVTAGASTPAWVIRDVVNRVHAIGWQRTGKLPAAGYSFIKWLTGHHILWAVGTALLTAAVHGLISGELSVIMPLLVALLLGFWRYIDSRLNPGLDIGVIAVLTVIASLPLFMNPSVSKLLTTAFAFYLGSLLLTRLLFHDYLNVQADRIAGHRTLPVLLSESAAEKVTMISITVSLISTIAMMWMVGGVESAAPAVAPIGNTLCLINFRRKAQWLSVSADLCMDTPIWIAALAVLFLL